MNHPLGDETPRKKLATAQATFALAVRVNSEVIAGRIRTTIYQRAVHVITGGTGVVLPPAYGADREDLLAGTFNLVIIALGASALTADETLIEVFGPVDKDLDQTRTGLRIMIHQLRNAFAHNPWRPKWIVREKYRRSYVVPLGDTASFVFDATSLDGDGVKPDQIGGLESWIKLLKHCEAIVPK